MSLLTVVAATPSLPEPNNTQSIDDTVNNLTRIRNVTLESASFGWEDYSVLAVMLIVSCGIGVFYGYFGEKPTSGDDFLLGGSSMGTFPMSLSLAARLVVNKISYTRINREVIT